MPEMPEQATIRAELIEFLRSGVLAEGVAIDDETPLASVGIDSMSLVQILLWVERKYGVEVPDEELTRENTATVRALAACIHRAGQAV